MRNDRDYDRDRDEYERPSSRDRNRRADLIALYGSSNPSQYSQCRACGLTKGMHTAVKDGVPVCPKRMTA